MTIHRVLKWFVVLAGIVAVVLAKDYETTSTTTQSQKHDGLSNHSSSESHSVETPKQQSLYRPEGFREPENVDETDPSSSSSALPPRPFFFVEESIWNEIEVRNEALVSPFYRVLAAENSGFRIDDNQYQHSYTNYKRDEVHEHEEELITADDDDFLDRGVDDDPDTVFNDDPETGSSNASGDFPDSIDDDDPQGSFDGSFTEPPTLESYWGGLNDYDQDEESSNFADVESDFYDAESDYSDAVDDTDILLDRPLNSVVVRYSLAIVHLEQLNKTESVNILGMTLRTVSILLNNNTNLPVCVEDDMDKFYEKYMQRRELRPENQRQRSQRPSPFSPSSRTHAPPRRKGDRFDFDFSDEVLATLSEQGDLAKLVLHHIVVKSTDHKWWEVSAIYSVWREPRRRLEAESLVHGELVGDSEPPGAATAAAYPERRQEYVIPVKSRQVLQQLEWMAGQVIEASIESKLYWETLNNLHFGNKDLVVKGEQNAYFVDDKGLFDIQAIGDEYDISSGFCPELRPEPSEPQICMTAPALKPPSLDQGYSRGDGGTIIYSDVIADNFSEIEWETREWFGLGLMLSTVFSVIVLSVASHLLSERRKRQRLWGAALTHHGVDDILKVGWRVYEQPKTEEQQQTQHDSEAEPSDLTDFQQQQQQQQLFLQIYDKGKGQGYNDENSLLRGGVEQQIFAPPAAAAFPPPPQAPVDGAAPGASHPP